MNQGSRQQLPTIVQSWRLYALVSLLLLLISAWLRYPLLQASWIHLDDPYYVLSNKHVRTGLSLENLHWAFTTVHHGNWMPLTWLSYQLDASLYGTEPWGYHLSNLMLDYAASLLFFVFLNRLSRALLPSLLATLLFSLHPLHVEPVAWISSRKDLLSGVFSLATLLCYCSYFQGRSVHRYLLLCLCFACALLAKPSSLPLPLVLLAIDYCFSQRILSKNTFINCLLEKLPLLCMSAAVLLTTLLSYDSLGPDIHHGHQTLGQRGFLALGTVAQFANHAFWPVNLAVEYPTVFRYEMAHYGLLLALAAISICFLIRKRSCALPLLGLLWFFILIAPASGIVPIGKQLTPDRYMYLPLGGLCISLTWLVFSCTPRTLALSVLLSATLLCGLISAQLQQHWANSVFLFTAAIRDQPQATRAYQYLGEVFERQGQLKKAQASYVSALQVNPDAIASFLRLKALNAKTPLSAPSSWLHFQDEAIEQLSFSQLIVRAMMLTHVASSTPDCQFANSNCIARAAAYLQEAEKKQATSIQLQEAKHLLGGWYYRNKEFDKAARQLQTVVAIQTQRISAKLLLMHCQIELGDLSAAQALQKELSALSLNAREQKQFNYLQASLSEKRATTH